jgi:hypothetical protein
MLRGLLPLVLLASLAGCSKDDNSNDGGTGDMAVQLDDGGNPLDLTIVSGDMVCANQVFAGFFGVTPSERRLECACGCTVDPFTGAVVAGYWNSAVPGATFLPSANGLGVSVASDGGVEIAALNSLNPASPFFIDGDFDLLVDYQISGTPPNGSHIILNTLNETLPGATGTYRVARERSATGTDQYSAELGGIAPVKLATSATQGTLRLERTGFTFRASGDGNQVTQFLAGAKARMTIVLTAALDAGCTGPACTLSITWKNLRLAKGALVDRR